MKSTERWEFTPSSQTPSLELVSATTIVAIDGPAGTGKSTIARLLAERLELPCIDTGAMYRLVALRSLEANLDLKDESAIVKIADSLNFDFRYEAGKTVLFAGEQASAMQRVGAEIRTPQVSAGASKVAILKNVRAVLVAKQQEQGKKRGAVMEGRDAGTVIFPKATIKFFLTASPEVRAKRRHLELVERLGEGAPPMEKVLADVNSRDYQDENREVSPMKPAEDSSLVDTSNLSIQELVDQLESAVKARMA